MATAVTTAGSRAVHHFPGRNSDKVIAYCRVRRKPECSTASHRYFRTPGKE